MFSRSGVALLLLLTGAGCTRQSPAPEQANGATRAPDVAAATSSSSKAGAVDRSHKGEALPAAALTDLDGKPMSLAGLRGKPMLVNLWATWCAPCVAELPSLDAASAGVTAIALNQGEDAAKVRPFLGQRKLQHLRPLLDPSMGVSLGLGANLPTTLLYDASGKEIWRVTGGRDWSSADSHALLAEAG